MVDFLGSSNVLVLSKKRWNAVLYYSIWWGQSKSAPYSDEYWFILLHFYLPWYHRHSSQLFNSMWLFIHESSSNIVLTGGFWGCSIRSRAVVITIDMFLTKLSEISLNIPELFTDFELSPMTIAAIQPKMKKLNLLRYRFVLIPPFW